ncbi:hypothetical protein AAG906_000476 [Vitis piasezkii]
MRGGDALTRAPLGLVVTFEEVRYACLGFSHKINSSRIHPEFRFTDFRHVHSSSKIVVMDQASYAFVSYYGRKGGLSPTRFKGEGRVDTIPNGGAGDVHLVAIGWMKTGGVYVKGRGPKNMSNSRGLSGQHPSLRYLQT